MIHIVEAATFGVVQKAIRPVSDAETKRMRHIKISKQRLFDGIDLFVALLAALIADRAACLASGLAAGLALAAADVAALFHPVFDYAVDVFHNTPPSSFGNSILIYRGG